LIKSVGHFLTKMPDLEQQCAIRNDGGDLV
jgi:hypothetical protein